jgi:hypothetical protein
MPAQLYVVGRMSIVATNKFCLLELESLGFGILPPAWQRISQRIIRTGNEAFSRICLVTPPSNNSRSLL